ncbi:MAG: co-chaperone YbbN [Nocardioidaceae bacterium]
MTVPQFSRPGAVDLSAFRIPTSAPGARAAGSTGGGGYVVEVTGEDSLRVDVVDRSLSVVVLLSIWSPDLAASVQINATLSKLADEFAGRFVLATLDAKAQADLVSLLGVPSVPLVVAALRGQLAPLIQEPLAEAEMRALIEQILQAAAASGITGTAEPAPAGGSPEATETPEPPARYPAAEDALMRGDYDAAVQQYEAALQATPGDDEAVEGLARASLLKRTAGVDPAVALQAADDAPDDIAAQLTAADVALLQADVDVAFDRLLALVRRTTGTDRDTVRKHLLELFVVVGEADPRVGRTRRALMAALY